MCYLSAMPQKPESKRRLRVFREAVIWGLMIVGFTLLVFGIKSCQEQARTEEMKARLPAGWLVTNNEIIRLPEDDTILILPEYMENVITYIKDNKNCEIYYTKSDEMREKYIFYKDVIDLRSGITTSSRAIPKPNILGRIYISPFGGFCVDRSGRYVAFGAKLIDRERGSIMVFFYDNMEQKSKVKSDFLSVYASDKAGCFWVKRHDGVYLYNLVTDDLVFHSKHIDFDEISLDGTRTVRIEKTDNIYILEVCDLPSGDKKSMHLRFRGFAHGFTFVGKDHIILSEEIPIIGYRKLIVVEVETGHRFALRGSHGWVRSLNFLPEYFVSDRSYDGEKNKEY